MGHDLHKQTPFYRPRNPSASPFFCIVQQYFDDFERIYPEKYERKYGFWYDRSLLGKLCGAAWDTVRHVYAREVDGDCGIPAMVGAVQTFGDLVHWHSYIHAVVAEGVFTESGYFVHIPDIWLHRAIEIWQEKVFALLLDAGRIGPDVVANMRGWRHSGFSMDNSVRIEAADHSGMQRSILDFDFFERNCA